MNTPPLLSDVISKSKTLPSAPWLLPKLMQRLGDSESGADQVEALIKMDAGLASGTLRLANSAYFNSSSPCDSLNEAIVRLGFREIYRLATTKVASGWLSNKVNGYGWEPGDLYSHSLIVAVAADLLAKELGTAEPEIAYTAGLLHDVGKLALAYVCAERFDQVRRYQQEKQCPWRVAEHEIFGFDHTDVGGKLLEDWTFPPNLVEVARFYPRPRLSSPENRHLVTLVHAAKHIALCVGTGVGEEGFKSEIDAEALREDGIGAELSERLMPEVLSISTRLLETQSPK